MLPTGLTRESLLGLYERLVLLRRFESTAQERCRAGEIVFLHLYIGEEATAVGVCAHLAKKDWVTSTHRGHGHALAKGMTPRSLMAELFAKADGCCGGRGGSMHLYDPDIGLFGTNGIVCGGMPSAVGAALSAKVRGSGQVAVAFFGDGGVNTGSFHESINFAGVQKAPVVFVCENNLYATATPLRVATLNTDVSSKATSYGIPGVGVDGNDVLAVWFAARTAVERARAGEGPTLIECRTYRTVGHHEGDPVVGVYRTQEEIDLWKKRDPILLFRRRLAEEFKIASLDELDAIEARVQAEVTDAVEFARKSPQPDPASAHLHTWHDPINPPLPPPAGPAVQHQGWLDAVRDGIAEEMRRDPNIIYFGEGIGERGGSFAQTKNLWHEFGARRVIDTPISELGFTGASAGASATGCRAVADLMFIDFLFDAAGQVALQAAKLRYMSGGRMGVPMIVRAAAGAIKNGGPHHSGAYHPIWSHLPGLIVVMPSNPADAKGLMKTALRAYDPVIFLEPKTLFSAKGDVPEGEHLVPFGLARVARSGTDITVVTCGQMVQVSLEAAGLLEKEGISCDVVDLRSLVPLDLDTIAASVGRTGHLLVVDEGYAMCGMGAEICQSIMEVATGQLAAAPGRIHTDPASHPINAGLWETILINPAKIVQAVRDVRAGRPPLPRRPRGLGGAAAAAAPMMPTATAASPIGTVAAASAPAAEGESLNMPHGDLTIDQATVVKWLKKPGDPVAKGEAVVDVETDKAVMGVESNLDGVLVEISAPEGQVVKMGQRLAVIRPRQ